MEKQWKDKISNGVTKSKEKVAEFKNMSKEERKEKADEYIGFAKEQGKALMGDVKQFKTLSIKKKRRIFMTLGCVLLAFICLFSLLPKGNKTELTKDGTAYQLTVDEYCERFNEIAGEPWCSGDENILRMQVEAQKRSALEKAAQLDASVGELLIQLMTPEMIRDVTLIQDEASEELPNSEKYVTYTFKNQYSFIAGNITIQLLVERETDYVKGVSAIFPMGSMNIGDKLGKLVCSGFGEDSETGGFHALYGVMKDNGGYGHSYKDGTVFELSYYDNDHNDNPYDANALFKMSACTKEHYDEAWGNLTYTEKEIINTEEVANTEEETTSAKEEVTVTELLESFEGYDGSWDEFSQLKDSHCQLLVKVLTDSGLLSEYFGEDLSTVGLYVPSFQWDGELPKFNLASSFFTIDGENLDTGEYVSISGVINVDKEGNFQVQIAN